MLLGVVMMAASLVQGFNNPCLPGDQEEYCVLENQIIQTNESMSFSAASSIEFTNVTFICFAGLQSQQACSVQMVAEEITLTSSLIVGSLIELNATTISLDNTTLSANGTAPFNPYKVCLDKGGSYGGRGGGNCRTSCSDLVYGSPYYPTDFGSPGQGDIATGGGSIVLACTSLGFASGEISAAGNVPLGSAYFGTEGTVITQGIGGGSGGSVLILTESYTAGSDTFITVAGGTGGSFSYGGGGGRVALYGTGPEIRVIATGGATNDTIRACSLGGTGTFYQDSVHTIIVDNNNVKTNNVTPLRGNYTIRLQVLNGAQAAPLDTITTLSFATIAVVNALIVQGVDDPNTFLPSILNISSPLIQLSNGASIGAFDETWIEITTQNMTIDTTSGLFFGGLVNITAFYLVLNGEIVGNVQSSAPTSVMIYSQYVDILSEGIISADMMGIVSWGGSFYLQGDIESPGSTCTSPSKLTASPVYQCLNITTFSLQYPNVSALLPSNYTIFVLATSSLEVVDSGKILGSRIGLCSEIVVIEGTVSSTGFGCMSGTGSGHGGYLPGECLGSGGGYGGKGGVGMRTNGTLCDANPGGSPYGLPNQTWYEGSGGGSSEEIAGAGGGFIILTGLYSITITQGRFMANGEDSPPSSQSEGAGGGAGGSIWIITQYLIGHLARIWALGGDGAGLGAGGGGGRVLFQWIGKEGPNGYLTHNHNNCSEQWQLSNVSVTGGISNQQLYSEQAGSEGSIVSLQCTPGHYGPFCQSCDVGYFKEGWEYSVSCERCSNKPGTGTYTKSAWHSADCPYRCPSTFADASQNPHCYSPLEIFIDYFGGPGGAIGVFVGAVGTLTALGFLAHAYTVKFVLKRTVPKQQKPNLRSSPTITSYGYGRKTMSDASPELTREDLPFHHKRFFLLGDNSYYCPWALPLIPCSSIEDEVILEEFANFADRLNSLLRWHTWEYVILVVLTAVHHPAARFWIVWRRKRKYSLLMNFVRGYEEVFWKRVDLRQLGNCLKVSTSHCYTVAALDIMNPSKKIEEWDERPELPLSIFCNGDGSFFCPYRLDSADLMVQFLAYSLDSDHLQMYYQFIDEFNTVTRTFDFSQEYPDTSSPQLSQLISLTSRYNLLIFNDRGFEVVPCLFQSLSTVHSGRYVFTSFSYSFSNDIFNVTSKRMDYQDTERKYCYKVGLIVTELERKSFDGTPGEERERGKDVMHWQPLALDVHSETLLGNNQISLASLPVSRLKSVCCTVKLLLASNPSGHQCVVLTGLLLSMFTDLIASAVTVAGFASEQYWGGVAVFLVVVPLTTVLGQVMGWAMLFRPAFIRTYISFQLSSLINVVCTFVYCWSIEDYFVWSLFLVLDFLCKIVVIRLASMHLAHAETYTLPAPTTIGSELLESSSFISSRSSSIDIKI